jgi:hypothetical protein
MKQLPVASDQWPENRDLDFLNTDFLNTDH